MDHVFASAVCLICYCACSETVTIVLLPQILNAKLSSLSPVLYRTWIFANLAAFWAILATFKCACAETAIRLLPVWNLTPLSNSPCPISYMTRNFGIWATISGIFRRFLLRMRRNGHKTTSGHIFNPKFETPMGCFLLDYEFWGAYSKIYTCFKRKMDFIMQHFCNLGTIGGGGDHFWRNPKRHILGWFHAFWAIMRANLFTRFLLGD